MYYTSFSLICVVATVICVVDFSVEQKNTQMPVDSIIYCYW